MVNNIDSMTLLHSYQWHNEVTSLSTNDIIKTTVNNIDSMTLLNSTTDTMK